MTIDAFIGLAFWTMVGVVVAVFAMRALARRYPGTAFRPFRSRHEVGAYFSFAREITRFDKRLLRYPIYLTILNYLVAYLPGWIYTRSQLVGTAGGDVPPDVWWTLRQPVTLSGLLHALVESAAKLPYGHFGFLTMSGAVFVLSLVAVLACDWTVRRLRGHIGKESSEGLVFLRRALGVLRHLLLGTGIPLLIALVLHLPDFIFWFTLAFAVVVSAANILIASLVEGLILFYVAGFIRNEKQAYGDLLKRSLSVLKPLFELNIILALGLGLGALIVFPFSLQSLFFDFSSAAGSIGFSLPFWLAAGIARYFSPLFALATVWTPFFLLTKKLGVKEAFRANFTFTGKHFLKYLTMMAAAVCLLSVPRLLSVLLAAVIPRMTYMDFAVRFILAVLGMALAVYVFLALFKFYHDYSRE